MAKAVKLADIAGQLGVSTVTVSKALSGQKGVSEEMREKIKKWPKKKLKKKLEKFGYYVEQESKQEMLALYLSLTADELPALD